MADKRQSKPTQPADQNADYDSLAKENRRLTDLNKDLHTQLTAMRASRTLSPEEDAANAIVHSERNRMREDINKIALWLRNNKSKEILEGRHTGLSLPEIVIMYMAKGLDK